MREIEEEKAARTRERMMQEEAKREEERRMRQRKLEEADSLLNHAEEALDSCKSPLKSSVPFPSLSCIPLVHQIMFFAKVPPYPLKTRGVTPDLCGLADTQWCCAREWTNGRHLYARSGDLSKRRGEATLLLRPWQRCVASSSRHALF